MEPLFHLIYLRDPAATMLLSRELYADWKQIQDRYDNYMASFGPWSLDEVIEFLEWDFGDKFTFVEAARLRSFADSDQLTTEVRVAS